MTTFDDREQAFEAKFAHDEEVQFRILARRNRLLGQWAADRLKLTPEEADAYAKSVVQAEFEEAHDEEVFRKVYSDLSRRDDEVTELQVRQAMADCMVEARRQLMDIV